MGIIILYLVNGDDVGKDGESTGSDITLDVPNGSDDSSVEVVTPQPVDEVRVLWTAAEKSMRVC